MLVYLVVAPGAGDPEAVAEAVRRHAQGSVDFAAVWAGDPHLRPAGRWADRQLDEPTGVGWNRLLVALEPGQYALARALQVVAQRAPADTPTAVLLVGAATVVGAIDAVAPSTGMAAIARELPPPDGWAPTIADVAAAGRWRTSALWFAPGSNDLAGALSRALVGARGHAGALLSLALDAHGATPIGGESPVIDATDLRAGNTPTRPGEAAGVQAAATPAPLTLPGGVVVDSVIRALTDDAIGRWRRGAGELPPEPFGPDGSAFLAWLEQPWPPWGPDVGRYWTALRESRADLIDAFPAPAGADQDAFTAWVRNSWQVEPRSALVQPGDGTLRPPWRSTGHGPDGLNVIGYIGFDNSIADVARRALASLVDAGVPVAALDYHRSGSPRTANPPPDLTDELQFATNLAFVNGDQFPLLDQDYGEVLWPGRRTIAYWFWELAYVPPHLAAALDHVDELWVGSEFVADAFRAVTDIPVRTVRIPVPEPAASGATRADLDLPDGRFVFLVTFDHLSVTERKNPFGAIEAFRRAFPEPTPDGPVLVVKTLNREHRWEIHDRLHGAAGGQTDIVIVDRHLARPDQMALIREADCLVSLHRSEGLGLHLLEAMWLGTPTLATRYSGNVDFMHDGNSALVDATLIGVTNGEGYLPEQGEWADPDLDQAAEWMRRLAAEPDLRERLIAAGRVTVAQQPTLAEVGAEMARLAGVRDKIGTR